MGTESPSSDAALRMGARWGIRTRLLLLVLALLLPFLAFLVFGAARDAVTEREHARRQMLGVAQVSAARLEDHIGNIYQLLATLTHAVSPRAADAVRNDRLLKSLQPELPAQLSDIGVWTDQGDNIGSLDPGSTNTLGNVAARPFFRKALQTRGLSVEAPAVSPTSGDVVAVFAMPLVEGGRTVAVISASMRLLDLQALLDPKASLPPGGVITVQDADGVVLSRSIDARKWIGRTIRGTAWVQGDARHGGIVDGRSADGRERVAGVAHTSAVPWSVYVGIPADIVLQRVHEQLVSRLLVGVAALLFGLLLATWVAERIARPLRQLANDAAILGSGDLAHRTPLAVGGEAGQLASTLNRMAATLQQRDAALQRSEDRLRQVTDNVPSLVSYLDRDLRFRFANRAYRDWLGCDPQSLIGRSLADLYGAEVAERISPMMESAFAGKRIVYERELSTPEGVRHVEVTLVPHFDDDGTAVQGLYALMHDITARRDSETRLRQLAQYDSLTGLPNRALFRDRLRQALARAQRGGAAMALLFVDIDHFKPVNDTHGHAAGDALLCELARRLQSCVRATDTVARLGGDEFTVVLEGLSHAKDAHMMADRIVEAMRRPVHVEGQELQVSASIGVALRRPGDPRDDDGEHLLRRADAALYRVKQAGRDGWHSDFQRAADSVHASLD